MGTTLTLACTLGTTYSWPTPGTVGDGLTSYVPDQQIAATLRAVIDSTIARKCLVALSLAQGGRDIVTVIVARYETFAG